jgi:hypothetical protein
MEQEELIIERKMFLSDIYIYFFLLDFPHERVPVILGPLLYPESEDLAPEKLTDTSSMPKSVVS